jgi:hypothetical protein
MAILDLQTNYTAYRAPGIPGTLINGITVEPYQNIGGLTAQVVQLDFGAITASTVYTIVVDGTVLTLTSAATGETATTLRDKFLALARASVVNGNYIFSASGAASLIATSRLAGIASSITASGAALTVNSGAGVAAATAGRILPGLLVARKAGDPTRSCRVPTAVSDIVLGFAVAHHSREIGLLDGFGSGEDVGVLRDGSIYALVEEPVTEDSPVFYRRAVNGALTTLGILATTAGTGLTALPNAAFKGTSFSIEGLLAVEVSAQFA